MNNITSIVLQNGASLLTTVAKQMLHEAYIKKFVLYYGSDGRGSYFSKKEIILKKIVVFIQKYDKKILSVYDQLCDDTICILGDVEDRRYYRIDANVIQLSITHDKDYDGLKLAFKIIGPNAKSILAVFEKCLDVKEPDSIYYAVSNPNGFFQGRKKYGSIPSFDSIIGPSAKILRHEIGLFLNKKWLYDKYNLLYKYNILLEGPPGTSKSSMYLALAKEYKLPLFIINGKSDMETICARTIDGDESQYTKRPFLCILEELDLFIKNNSTGAKDDTDTLELLLQLLDGIYSCEYAIIIITTNHVDELDPRLIRPGRIDLTIHCGNVDKEDTYDFKKEFDLTDNEFDLILSQTKADEEGKYNPALLKNKIISFIKRKKLKEENDNG